MKFRFTIIKDTLNIFSIISGKDKALLFTYLAFMIIASAIQTISVALVPTIVEILQNPDHIESIKIIIFIRNYLNYGGQLNVWVIIIILVILYLLSTICDFIVTLLEARSLRDLASDLGVRLFNTYLRAPYSYHITHNSAQIIRNLNQEVIRATNSFLGFMRFLMNGITLTFMAVLLLLYEPKISAIVILFSLFIGLGFVLFTRGHTTKWGKKVQSEQGKVIKIIKHAMGGIKNIKVSGSEPEYLTVYSKTIWNLMDVQRKNRIINAILPPFMKISGVIFVLLIIYLLKLRGDNISDVVPILALFGAALTRIMPSVSGAMQALKQIYFLNPSANLIYSEIKLFDIDKEKTVEKLSEKNRLPDRFESNIVIDNVSYSYPNTSALALKNINLDINKGDMIGIVGQTGAGKSTLIDILLGLLDVKAGVITIDGINIYNDLQKWRKKIGFVPQSIYILDDTVRANVAFGIKRVDVNDDRIWNVLEKTRLDSVIKGLPKGLDTKLGEDGIRLSGGERQRLGLSRALYHNPEILILDEGTSALDNKTESEIIKNIHDMKKEHTIIIVAHRLSSVRNCDCVYMFKHGTIVAHGTYDELIKSNVEFKLMVNAQIIT